MILASAFAIIFDWAAAIAMLAYVVLVGFMIFKLPLGVVRKRNKTEENKIALTIIIPFRNEAENLLKTLHSVLVIAPENVLLIDDHSEDNSAQIAREFCANNPNFQYHSLINDSGKKAAISVGVALSKTEYIATLDADITIGPNWKSEIASQLRTSAADYLILPVAIEDESSGFAMWQALEFSSLIGTTFAFANAQNPIMSNGANVVFKRSAFLAKNGFERNANIASGDDLFLLFALKKNKAKIDFNFTRETVATTQAAPTLSAFLAQRTRWTEKSKHYTDKTAQTVAAITLLANFVLFGFLAAPFIHVAVLVFLFALKASADLLFLLLVLKHFRKLKLLAWFVPLLVAYPLYLLILLVLGMVKKPLWKGRPLYTNK